MKNLFCVLTVVCLLASVVASGTMSVAAAEFGGNKDKLTSELLEAVENSGEGDVLSVWLWYEGVADMQPVASEISARVSEALAYKGSIPYNTFGNILDKAGLSGLKEGALAQIESILTENADRSNEWKVVEVSIMTERYLTAAATEKKADALIAALGIPQEQIVFKSIFSPSMIVNATVEEIEKITENESVWRVYLNTTTPEETNPPVIPVKTPQFRVVPAKVRPFTTPDKYVNPNDYAAVRAEYVVWFFNDERGEERCLFAKASTPREEITYWLPGKGPDYSTIDHTAERWDEEWYGKIVFETPGKTVVGLPDDAECVTEWYVYGERKLAPEFKVNEDILRNSLEKMIATQNKPAVDGGALLVNPYVELGGRYDLDKDGIAEEKGWDKNGDGITEVYVNGMVSPYGDANDDGEVNMKDVLVLRKIMANIDVECNRVNADANGDGELNMKDVLTLRKFLVGSIEKL